ncbi:transposase [Burkholderia pyrrocinia]|uniref:transposase n=1 Tax=Burkholderia pyrrocinia TaxID=60550 RepID=UPI003D768998
MAGRQDPRRTSSARVGTRVSYWRHGFRRAKETAFKKVKRCLRIAQMIGAQKPIFLVLDGHPIHKSRLVLNFVKAQKGRLKLFYLPPYWPHLNPDEQVWAHVKRSVSKRLVQTKGKMKRSAIGALRRIQKLPALVKSFFRQLECQYAAM